MFGRKEGHHCFEVPIGVVLGSDLLVKLFELFVAHGAGVGLVLAEVAEGELVVDHLMLGVVVRDGQLVVGVVACEVKILPQQ